jgi:hypothetical protein
VRNRTSILSLVLGASLVATVLVSAPASASPAVAGSAPAATSLSAPTPADIASAAAALKGRYTQPSVVTSGKFVIVTFADHAGQQYSFTFVNQLAPGSGDTAAPGGVISPNYQTSWYWWGWRYWLNRSETYSLITEGLNAAIIYAIAAAVGCLPCVLGAAVEMGWSQAASTYYNNGNCIYINNPYMTVGEHHSHGC